MNFRVFLGTQGGDPHLLKENCKKRSQNMTDIKMYMVI